MDNSEHTYVTAIHATIAEQENCKFVCSVACNSIYQFDVYGKTESEANINAAHIVNRFNENERLKRENEELKAALNKCRPVIKNDIKHALFKSEKANLLDIVEKIDCLIAPKTA